MSLNVFITGGASGIGYGIAEHLAKDGHHIIVADINPSAAQSAARQLTEAGFSAQAIDVDVCDAQQVAALPGRLDGVKVDVLVNNAGIQHVAKIEDFPSGKMAAVNQYYVGGACAINANIFA